MCGILSIFTKSVGVGLWFCRTEPEDVHPTNLCMARQHSLCICLKMVITIAAIFVVINRLIQSLILILSDQSSGSVHL